MGFGIICCDFFLWQKKKPNWFHVMLPNRLLNTNIWSNWLHLLILFFSFLSAYSFRLLLRSCCWGSQWDWSVILWQITTMLVRFLAISVSTLYPESKAGIPSLVCGIPLHSLLSAAGMAASNRGWCGQCWVELPEPFVYKFDSFAWQIM